MGVCRRVGEGVPRAMVAEERMFSSGVSSKNQFSLWCKLTKNLRLFSNFFKAGPTLTTGQHSSLMFLYKTLVSSQPSFLLIRKNAPFMFAPKLFSFSEDITEIKPFIN